MGKQVPLVIYINEVRRVIGMASIGDDGSVETQVADDAWPVIKNLINQPGSSSFSPSFEIALAPAFPASIAQSVGPNLKTPSSFIVQGSLGDRPV